MQVRAVSCVEGGERGGGEVEIEGEERENVCVWGGGGGMMGKGVGMCVCVCVCVSDVFSVQFVSPYVTFLCACRRVFHSVY